MLKILGDYAKLGYEFKFFNCEECDALHIMVSKDLFKNGVYFETIGARCRIDSDYATEDLFIADLNEAIRTIEELIKVK